MLLGIRNHGAKSVTIGGLGNAQFYLSPVENMALDHLLGPSERMGGAAPRGAMRRRGFAALRGC
ncbi:hypothetical protein BN13_540009 [Nostocoides jenkinsii Ben 74]|uniref:Uncharacterized protein n=1 Tax=Nostocoides jenkinsii Ben 74 TaxID=1193518 RepID=A0A077M9I7_9MICO|nr:hypothetical protein BN13_540009 [Tetrasphaera jenkinsii Ben 74]